jgi:hypothetical protein
VPRIPRGDTRAGRLVSNPYRGSRLSAAQTAGPAVWAFAAFREATLGPAGSYLTHTGVVVATDGSVKDDGRMGAAYVALDNRLPPRMRSTSDEWGLLG